MNTLVTGGAGFIGSHVARVCLEAGHSVTVLDDLSGGFAENVPPSAEFVKGSVDDDNLVRKLFNAKRFQYVYHFAAYAAEGLSHFIRRFNYTNNVRGTVTLINAAVAIGTVERFVFASSIAVYGSAQVPMTEETAPEPEDPYGIAKYAAELDLKAASRMFGLEYTIFRPHNVYGEGQNIGDRYRNVIGIFMNQLMQGQPMTIFGDGTQTRAFSYVGDIAPIVAASVHAPNARNQIFNIGADTPYTINDLARAVAAALDRRPDIRYLDARSEVQHAYSDHSKARALFGKDPDTPLDRGLSRMAKWAKSAGVRPQSTFAGIEVTRNLPPSWRYFEAAR